MLYSVLEWVSIICHMSVVFYLYLRDSFCNVVSKYIPDPIWKYLACWQSRRGFCPPAVCSRKNQNSHVRTVTCYTVLSALLFKAFLCVFGMKLSICVLYEVPQESKNHEQPQTDNMSVDRLVISPSSQTIRNDPHVWDTFAFSAHNTNSDACQLSLLPYIMIFIIHKHRKQLSEWSDSVITDLWNGCQRCL